MLLLEEANQKLMQVKHQITDIMMTEGRSKFNESECA
jgi:hypothetical protein